MMMMHQLNQYIVEIMACVSSDSKLLVYVNIHPNHLAYFISIQNKRATSILLYNVQLQLTIVYGWGALLLPQRMRCSSPLC